MRKNPKVPKVGTWIFWRWKDEKAVKTWSLKYVRDIRCETILGLTSTNCVSLNYPDWVEATEIEWREDNQGGQEG